MHIILLLSCLNMPAISAARAPPACKRYSVLAYSSAMHMVGPFCALSPILALSLAHSTFSPSQHTHTPPGSCTLTVTSFIFLLCLCYHASNVLLCHFPYGFIPILCFSHYGCHACFSLRASIEGPGCMFILFPITIS